MHAGIYSDSASFSFTGGLIDSNIAGGSGGGVVLHYGAPYICESALTGNIGAPPVFGPYNCQDKTAFPCILYHAPAGAVRRTL